MKIPQETISEKEIYNNGRKKVLVRVFQTADGKQKEVPIYSDAQNHFGVMTLVLDKENNIYYGNEYRDGPECFVTNFCVGKHSETLTFKETATKELKEELGGVTNNIEYLGEAIVSAYDTARLKYFIARDCIFQKQELEDGENFEIQKCTIKEFEQKIISGEINCPHTICCYTKAKLQNKI